MKTEDDFWKNKVEEVARISKEYGYEELKKEFWDRSPAVLISLILDIYNSKEKEPK